MKIKLIILLQQMTAKEINPFDWMRETKKSLKKVISKNFEWGKFFWKKPKNEKYESKSLSGKNPKRWKTL